MNDYGGEGEVVDVPVMELSIVDEDFEASQFKVVWMHLSGKPPRNGLFDRFMFESLNDMPPQITLIRFLASRCRLSDRVAMLIVQDHVTRLLEKS